MGVNTQTGKTDPRLKEVGVDGNIGLEVKIRVVEAL